MLSKRQSRHEINCRNPATPHSLRVSRNAYGLACRWFARAACTLSNRIGALESTDVWAAPWSHRKSRRFQLASRRTGCASSSKDQRGQRVQFEQACGNREYERVSRALITLPKPQTPAASRRIECASENSEGECPAGCPAPISPARKQINRVVVGSAATRTGGDVLVWMSAFTDDSPLVTERVVPDAKDRRILRRCVANRAGGQP